MGLSIGALLGERGVASEIVVVGRSPGAPDHPLFELSLTRYTRNLERPLRDGRLLITVPDGAIGQVAEELAGLPHQKRGGWHAFRRAWATRRKHLPVQDVMAAGGWRDINALQKAYQAADPETVRKVMELG